ncbi:MAG: DnaA regulatory inactivator Hda [Neisseriaceae bacterium]|nr:DnaA regulatory inactivator Hda [Neisseriaceae bacterium]
MSQLLLDLFTDELPSFDDFIAGENEGVLRLLRMGQESSVYLWGNTGTGKTYLAQSWVAYWQSMGNNALYIGKQKNMLFRLPENIDFVAVDDVHLCDESQAAALFTCFNQWQNAHVKMLFTAISPPMYLPLREDVRTRMAWGTVYEMRSLSDDDKINALRTWAKHRQLPIDDAVFIYLLRYYSRDLGKLSGCLKDLDAYALQQKRNITVPLVQHFLKQESN